CFFFFFQAEDGIRDRNVTGVQTCALPIYVRKLCFSRYRSSKKNNKCIPHLSLIINLQEFSLVKFPNIPNRFERGRATHCWQFVKIGRASCRESVVLSVL